MKKILQFVQVAICIALLLTVVNATAQDITSRGGSLTVSKENGDGPTGREGSQKLIDNDYGTKFLVGGLNSPLLITFQANAPAVVGQYTFTSGNDASNRDPKDWTLEASNNGTNWVVLDTRTNQTFNSRFLTRAYYIQNTTPYTYYRLNITAVNGSDAFQMQEWRLLEAAAPAIAPTDLIVNAVSGAAINVQWKDNALIENGYQIERSEANTSNYVLIATLGANASSYSDEGLKMNTRYYYRVRAVNPYGASAYTGAVSTTTLNLSGEVRDITDNGGTLTVSHENGSGAEAGEGSLKLLDNNKSSKFLVPNGFPSTGLWMQYQSATADEIVVKYSITSGNDAPERDAKSWVFQGSTDGASWITLDTRTDQVFTGRNQTRDFSFANTTPFGYYRWLVTANNGATNIAVQVSELEIWGISQSAPAVPTNLRVTDVTEREIAVAWDDVATNETGYSIHRSTDGVTFTEVGTVAANTSAFTDTNLRVLTKYYFRVRAIGEASNSIFSQIVNEITLYDENLPLPAEGLAATAVSETEVGLTWTDRADNETGYEIERSTDGTTYANIASVDANVGTYADQNLKLATRYYYRVRPINAYGQANNLDAPFTDVAEVITQGTNQAPIMADITNQNSCNVTDTYSIPLNSLSAGQEPDQNLSLSVTSDRSDMFSELAVSEVVDGAAILRYRLVKGQTGTANVTVTVKDDGGTLNGGADTYTTTFEIAAYELEATVSSQYDDILVPRGQALELSVSGADNYSYTWADGPGILSGQNSSVLTIKPVQNYVYRVTATTDEGCTKEIAYTVQMEGGVNLEANNILTPNGDGKNDVWVVWNINTFPKSRVRVLDTAGRVVYEVQDYKNDWDGNYQGSPLAQGVYYYIIDLGAGLSPVRGALTIIRD